MKTILRKGDWKFERVALDGLIIVCALLGFLPLQAQANSQTFVYTGADQSFSVPTGVTAITVEVIGGGGDGGYNGGGGGGGGGYLAGY